MTFYFQGLRKCFLEISIRLEVRLAALLVSPTDTKKSLFICFSRLGKRLQKCVSVNGNTLKVCNKNMFDKT